MDQISQFLKIFSGEHASEHMYYNAPLSLKNPPPPCLNMDLRPCTPMYPYLYQCRDTQSYTNIMMGLTHLHDAIYNVSNTND